MIKKYENDFKVMIVELLESVVLAESVTSVEFSDESVDSEHLKKISKMKNITMK